MYVCMYVCMYAVVAAAANQVVSCQSKQVVGSWYHGRQFETGVKILKRSVGSISKIPETNTVCTYAVVAAAVAVIIVIVLLLERSLRQLFVTCGRGDNIDCCVGAGAVCVCVCVIQFETGPKMPKMCVLGKQKKEKEEKERNKKKGKNQSVWAG